MPAHGSRDPFEATRHAAGASPAHPRAPERQLSEIVRRAAEESPPIRPSGHAHCSPRALLVENYLLWRGVTRVLSIWLKRWFTLSIARRTDSESAACKTNIAELTARAIAPIASRRSSGGSGARTTVTPSVLNAPSSIAVDRGLAGSTTTSKVSMNRTLGGSTDTDRSERLTDEVGCTLEPV